jgi:Arc/MetJ family transcription regulator
MTMTKVSLSLDEELVAEARAVAGPRRLSSYVNGALRRQLQHDRLAGFIDELEGEMDPAQAEALETVRRAWPGTGGSAAAEGASGKS